MAPGLYMYDNNLQIGDVTRRKQRYLQRSLRDHGAWGHEDGSHGARRLQVVHVQCQIPKQLPKVSKLRFVCLQPK